MINRTIERATELELNQRYESVKWLELDLDAASQTVDPALDPAPAQGEKPNQGQANRGLTKCVVPLLENLAIAADVDVEQKTGMCEPLQIPIS